MKRVVWLVVLCLVLVLPASVAEAVTPEAVLFGLINADREAAGLAPYEWDAALAEVARGHAEEMLALGYYAHCSPVSGSPVVRLRKAGIRFMRIGENIAQAGSPEAAHALLMQSSGHRANILSSRFMRVGIAVVTGGRWGLMVVEVFILPPIVACK